MALVIAIAANGLANASLGIIQRVAWNNWSFLEFPHTVTTQRLYREFRSGPISDSLGRDVSAARHSLSESQKESATKNFS